MKRHPWRDCEIHIAWQMYLAGAEINEIGEHLGRTARSIEYCLVEWHNPAITKENQCRLKSKLKLRRKP